MIRKKLEILKDQNVINQEILNFNLDILELLKERNIIEDDEEADTFITHLAMAMARDEDESINALEDETLEEIRADEDFEKAQSLWKEIDERAPINFHENETGYFHLHLVNLL